MLFLCVTTGRIDSVFTTVEFGVSEWKPQIPLGIAPVLTGHESLTGDCLTSQNVGTESASPNKSP